jgi:hypothetical protein
MLYHYLVRKQNTVPSIILQSLLGSKFSLVNWVRYKKKKTTVFFFFVETQQLLSLPKIQFSNNEDCNSTDQVLSLLSKSHQFDSHKPHSH